MIKIVCPSCGTEVTMPAGAEGCFCTECGMRLTAPAEEAPVTETETPLPEDMPADAADEALTEESAAEEPESIEEASAEAPETETEAPLTEDAPANTADEAPAKEETPETEAPAAEPVPAETPAAPEQEPEAVFTAGAVKEPAEEEPAEEPVQEEPVPVLESGVADADRAFENGKYAEALKLYAPHTGTNAAALFRSSLCSVYASTGASVPVAGFRTGVTAASNAYRESSYPFFEAQKDKEICGMLGYMAEHGAEFTEKLPSAEACLSQENGHVVIANLFLTAAGLLSSDEAKEQAMKAGVSFLDKALSFRPSYYAGQETAKNGKVHDVYEPYRPGKKQKAALKDAREHLAEQFNALPSRAAREQALTAAVRSARKERRKLNKEIDAAEDRLDAERAAFYKENAEAKAGRRKVLAGSVHIAAAILFVLAGLAVLALHLDIVWLFIAMLVLFIVFSVIAVRLVKASVAEYEKSVFPFMLNESVRKLAEYNAAHKACKKRLAAAEKALKEFTGTKL